MILRQRPICLQVLKQYLERYKSAEISNMRQFQSDMKARAHERKIKNAKATLDVRKSRQSQQRNTQQQDAILLRLYEDNNMSSIPIYKLLKSMGLQQYTKQLILRGYGVNISKLAQLNDVERKKLFEDIKLMPGHATKLLKIIDIISKSSRQLTNSSSCSEGLVPNSIFQKRSQEDPFMSELDSMDDYEKQLERVLNEYTTKDTTNAFKKDTKSKNFRASSKEAPKQNPKQPSISQIKDTTKLMMKSNIKYPTSGKIESTKKINDNVRTSLPNQKFQKKTIVASRPSAKDNITTVSKPVIKKQIPRPGTDKKVSNTKSVEKGKDRTQLEVQLKVDRVKTLFMSADGAFMTSSIINLDLQEQCYCLANYLQNQIKPAERRIAQRQKTYEVDVSFQKEDVDELQVQNILRQSYLHPLYKNQSLPQQVQENIEEVVEEEIDRQPQAQQQEQQMTTGKPLGQSSFLGCNDSVSFGLTHSLQIFQQPCPAQIDYYVPTADSLSNFMKNIVISAKMERQVPILSMLYIQKFISKTNISLTSLNYKRLLITCLLLASKVWDDESFQTPSFSHTFPDYPTVLLNQLEKQVLVAINYELKLNKRDYALLYYKLRQFRQPTGKSYQNRALNIRKVMELQQGIRKLYRTDFLAKRKSF